MKVRNLYLHSFIISVLLNAGCANLPQQEDSLQSEQEYSSNLAESKSVLFTPLNKDNILFSDESLAPLPFEDYEDSADKRDDDDEELGLDNPLTLNSESENLWQRISAGYSLLPQQDKTKYAGMLKAYRKYSSYFSNISKNAAPYLHQIVESVENRGMPLEIALLPAIESAYQPHARSPYQAEGLWQFIPSTGRLFGLTQNGWYDGRRDVVAATDAALDYLQILHDNLDGNWLLALAAYNCGEANVRRAIQKNLRQGKPTDYWSLDLPKETKEYIPRLMAVSEIIAKADDYGIDLEEIPNKPFSRKIDVGEQIDLKLAAELADIPFEQLKRLNPGFKQSVMAPKGPYYLVLPTEKIELFRKRLAQTTDKLPNGQGRPQVEQITSSASNSKAQKHYRIRKGDNLQSIARRHNVSVKQLRALNRINKRTKLTVGKTILIPNTDKTTVTSKQDDKKNKNILLAEKNDKKNNSAKRSSSTARHPKRIHTIRPGDALGKIASDYKTSIKALCELNGITTKTRLEVGKTLLIPPQQRARKI